MTEQYGNSKIKEVKISREEILKMIHDAIPKTQEEYDFNKPMILNGENGDVVFRFFERTITTS